MSDETTTTPRILSLANGRSPAKKGGDYITRAQAEQLAQSAYDAAHRMIEHYMQQIPGLVAQMLGDALTAHGLTMQPPPKPEVFTCWSCKGESDSVECGRMEASGFYCGMCIDQDAHLRPLGPPPAADDYYTAAADATIDRFMDE